MAFKHLQEFIDLLDSEGELIRVTEFVDPNLEITEVVDRISKSNNNKAILFENTGTDFPILINSMGSEKRMCLALKVDTLDQLKDEIEELFKMMTAPKEGILSKLAMLPKLAQFASWMPKVKSGKGACQEVIMDSPDLDKLPIMLCWPKDGGRYITLPVIHTKEPNSGIRNVGMYRMQQYDNTSTGMHWHKHKVSAAHFNEYKKLGKKMPVACVIGGDPAYTYAATAPLPENVDEYMLAGFLRKKKVELVKCVSQPEIEVPADADFVIEGYVDPSEDLKIEGPFGDHTGFYSLKDLYPIFHVTAITHKKNAVYPSTIVGIPPQEDAWIGKATERIFLAPIKMTMVPEIQDMNMPVEGVFHNLVLASIEKSFGGQAQKVMNAMWGAGQMMFNKILAVVDNQDLTDYKSLAQYVFRNINVAQDIYFSSGPMDVLDHSCSKMGFGGKMCIDGTTKHDEEIQIEEEHFELNADNIKASFKIGKGDILDVNTDLIKMDIPCLLLAVKKNRPKQVKKMTDGLFNVHALQGVKMILVVDDYVDVQDISSTLWQVCNNFDPKRDSFVEEEILANGKQRAMMIIDGTRKTKEHDNFQRDWPNIIVSNPDTIEAIDTKWDSLGLGEFIESPSLKFRKSVFGDEAHVS
jgi:4-hydroxy-3-polyprenylbenzoate decarboxylase